MNPDRFPKLISPEEHRVYDVEDIKACLDDAMRQKWFTWFNGKTGIILDGKFCVFDYDFHRFLEQQGILVGDFVPNYNLQPVKEGIKE